MIDKPWIQRVKFGDIEKKNNAPLFIDMERMPVDIHGLLSKFDTITLYNGDEICKILSVDDLFNNKDIQGNKIELQINGDDKTTTIYLFSNNTDESVGDTLKADSWGLAIWESAYKLPYELKNIHTTDELGDYDVLYRMLEIYGKPEIIGVYSDVDFKNLKDSLDHYIVLWSIEQNNKTDYFGVEIGYCRCTQYTLDDNTKEVLARRDYKADLIQGAIHFTDARLKQLIKSNSLPDNGFSIIRPFKWYDIDTFINEMM